MGIAWEEVAQRSSARHPMRISCLERTVDCIGLLKSEHQQLERLFANIDEGDVTVVPEICQSLDLHLMGEDGIFYPAIVDEIDGVRPCVDASAAESRRMRSLIRDLSDITAVDHMYVMKARDLVAVAREHVIDEESELYPKVSSSLSEKRRTEIGCAIEAFRAQGEASDEGASSDGDTSWTEDPFLTEVVDPDVDRSVEATIRRSQARQPPER